MSIKSKLKDFLIEEYKIQEFPTNIKSILEEVEEIENNIKQKCSINSILENYIK